MKNRRIARFLMILLSAFLALGFLASPALAEDGIQFVEVSDWTQLSNALSAGRNVRLTSNVAAVSGESTLVVPGEKTVILDLNGKTIDRFLLNKNAIADGYVIRNYGTLIIEDNSEHAATDPGTIRGGHTNGNGGGIYNQGTLAIRDGGIGLNRATGQGGGIYNAANAVLNIQGGQVFQNFAGTDGGGIYNAGTLNIYGGEVWNNTAFSHGGGIMQNGIMRVSAQPVVTGNHNASGQTNENNIYLDPASHVIQIEDTLETGANLGVTTPNNSGTITSGYSAHNGDTPPRKFFRSDNPEFGFRLSEGEAVTGEAEEETNVSYIQRYYNGTTVTSSVVTLDCVPVFPKQTEVPGGTYIVNQNITIDGRVELQDNTELILKDGYTLTVKGLTIAAGKILQIYGQTRGSGKLVSQPVDGAAISCSADGYIVIHGGQITATGAGTGAGIENISGTNTGYITIYNGKITATGGANGGSGIGGGKNSSPDNIAIHGGTVIATGKNGGAGIGGGANANSGAIRITGGTITATGSGTGAGIGGSGTGKAYVSIEGGDITATGSVGIGCGANSEGTAEGETYDVLLDWTAGTKDKIRISASNYRGRVSLSNNAHYFRNETYMFVGQYPDLAQLASSGAPLTAWDGTITSWPLLQQALNNNPFDGHLRLNGDITAGTADTCLLVPSGKEYILDMNGHTIDRNLSAYTDGGSALYVASGATLTIKDEDNSGDGGTIKNGYNNGYGGAIRNEGTLTIEGITISDSHAYGSGGGISNAGTLTMNNCTVTNCDTDKNSGSSAAYGGGIDNTGTLTMTGCVISDNKSRGFGAGICSNGTVSITDCVIRGNGPKRTDIREVYGGGIEIYDGTATITDTIIQDNTASMNGGGIFNYKGSLTISGGTITGNTSDLNGGGIMTFERIKIKGALKVYNNNTKGTNHCKDVCLPAPKMLEIADYLEGAEIHVGIAENLLYPVPGVIAYTYNIIYMKPEAFVPADVYTDCIIVPNENNNELELKQQYTVSFVPGDSATGEMNSVLVTSGNTYTLPANEFVSTENNKTFRCWSVQVGEDDPVERNPGDTVVITEATTVTPTWKGSVTYVDENGGTKTVKNYHTLIGTETTLAGGTYVLDSASLSLDSITLSGNVVLVLEDGCTLNLMGGISGDFNLTICGQSGQTGKLLAAGDVQVKDLTVGGGRIQSFNGTGLTAQNIKINAGSVNTGTIQATENEPGKGNVTINGGQVTAIAIEPITYVILGWARTTDFIQVNSFNSPAVTIKEGKALKNGSAVYSGNVDSSQLDGKKLVPSHLHHFTYSADGEILTATCDAAGLLPCTLADNKVTLTVVAPQKTEYGDSNSARASLEGLSEFNAATGQNISADNIQYNYGYLNNPPTDAGIYVASIKVENQRAYLYYTINPKQILITGATAKGRSYSYNNKSVEITSVTFDNGKTALVPDTDYMVTGEMEDDNAGSNKRVTATVILKNRNYTLARDQFNTYASIARIQYTGTTTASDSVPFNQAKNNVTLMLPSLPAGASYGEASINGELISEVAVSGATMTYSTTSQNAGATAMITIPVSGATNYLDYEVVATITAQEKAVTDVTIDPAGPVEKTFGDEPFTLIATAVTTGESSQWTWTSSNPDAVSVLGDGNTGTVTIKGTGEVRITATYESATTKGHADITLTVSPKKITIPTATSGLKWTGQELTGVEAADEYTVKNGKGTDVGDYYAAVSLVNEYNYVWSDNTTEPKEIAWSIAKKDVPILTNVALAQSYGITTVDYSFTAEGMPVDAGRLIFTKAGEPDTTGNVIVSDYEVTETGKVTAILLNGAAGDTVTLPVTIESTHYENATVNVVVTLTDKADAGVSIEPAGPVDMTYGDDPFTLKAAAQTTGSGGTWTWTSNDTSIAEVTTGSATSTVTIKGAGEAVITASYESATTKGNATITLKVSPKIVEIPTAAVGLKWTGKAQTGVRAGSEYTVTDGKKTDAGNYTATATLKDTKNYRWSDGNTAPKEIAWSIAKADAPVLWDITFSQAYGDTTVDSFVGGKMPDNAGKLTFNKGNPTLTGTVTVSGFEVTQNGTVMATLENGAPGNTITLPVIITSTNYQDATINVVITLSAKEDAKVSIEPAGPIEKTYGDASFTLKAEAVAAGAGERWIWTSSDTRIAEVTTGSSESTVTILNTCSEPVAITAEYSSGQSVGKATVLLTVIPKTVAIPTGAELKWTGEEQSGVAETAEYTVENGKATDAGNYMATVTLKDTNNYRWDDGTTAPKEIVWSIVKADAPAAPEGVAGIAPTSDTAHDGRITGVDATMEYRKDGEETWTAVTETEITGLTPGTYYIRLKATETREAGAAVQVTVPAYTPTAPDPEPAPAPDPEPEPEPESKPEPEPVPLTPEQKIRAFITRCYKLILGREPDSTGMAYWYEKLSSKQATAAQIVSGFFHSDEFRARGRSHAQIVDILYRTMLDREADAGGKAYWLGQINAGQSLKALINGFAGSTEFRNLCDNYGIIAGYVPVDPADPEVQPVYDIPMIKDFITRCYRYFLGREPDTGGMDYWVKQLTVSHMTAAEVVYGFITSAEYEARRPSGQERIEVLYQVMLNRKADAGGLAFWQGKLGQGFSMPSLVNGFAGSAEFEKMCSECGIQAGSVPETLVDTEETGIGFAEVDTLPKDNNE